MALTPQFGSLIPSATQQLLASNYLQFNAAGAGGATFAQQYLPEIYEQEVERYGNRTLVILDLVLEQMLQMLTLLQYLTL